MSDSTIIEACPLLLGTTSQRAELTALARALTLAKGKTVNIYTDSRHFTLYCPTLLSGRKGDSLLRRTPIINIINAALIAQVLEASRLPPQVGITHYKAHQTDCSIITRGKN
jgi:ribonuclease HI